MTVTTPNAPEQLLLDGVYPEPAAPPDLPPVVEDLVQAACGCIGLVVKRVDKGAYPFVSVQIREPHPGGLHPEHRERVNLGVISRFPPDAVEPYRPAL